MSTPGGVGNVAVPRRWTLAALVRRLPEGWPIVVSFVGYPLWWVLGLTQIIFFVMAVPMTLQLIKQRYLRSPRGFGIWIVYLIWVFTGLLVLHVTAPGTMPEQGASSYLTFMLRWAWYVIAGIAMLYIVNLRSKFTQQAVANSLAWLFVTVVAGGWLGLLLPQLEFASLLELLLPRGLASNEFVQVLVHARAAQLQDIVGVEAPRPSAPFYYSNSWGLVFATTVPFFIAAWWRRTGWHRRAVPLILVVGAVPVVASLNRGLWGALIAMAAFVVIRAALRGHVRALAWAGAVVILCVGALAVSPLGDLIGERLANPHSNEIRENLSSFAVQATVEGSPVVGFGTTRNLQGTFTSAAGGATDQCPGCGAPAIGTQGHLWLIIFGSGFGGLILYAAFILRSTLPYLRKHSTLATACLAGMIAHVVTLVVYDSGGLGTYVTLVVLGMLAREAPASSFQLFGRAVVHPVRRQTALVVGVALAFGLVGGAHQLLTGSDARASQSVVVSGADWSTLADPRTPSIDTEVELARSRPVLDAVAEATGQPVATAVANLRITVSVNTRVIRFTYDANSPGAAITGATAAADAYLKLRSELVASAQLARVIQLEDALAAVQQSANRIDAIRAKAGPPDILLGLSTQLDAQTQSLSAALITARSESGNAGTVVGSPRATSSRDPLKIAIASWGGIGLLLGLALAYHIDGRLRPLGPRDKIASRLDRDLAVVATARATTDDDIGDRDLERIVGAVRTYVPICGILADPDSLSAVRTARKLDEQIVGPHERSGSRAILVASSASHPRRVWEADDHARRSGVQLVGIVLLEGHAKRDARGTQESSRHAVAAR